MYPTLNAGTVNRSLATADLNVADSDTGADGLHAAVPPASLAQNAAPEVRAASAATFASASAVIGARGNWLMAQLGSERYRTDSVNGFVPNLAPRDAVFASLGTMWIQDRDRMQSLSSDPIFARQKPREEGDTGLDVPLFPDPSQCLQEDSVQPNPSGSPNDDALLDYIQPGSDLLGD
jgi:hypothetical protein